VLQLLASMGSCFDTATVAEIEMALAAGATPDRISYGNTIKKERDIARAFALGIRLFAVDCSAEVEKIARAAPAPRCSAAFSMIAPAPSGRCRASSAATRKWRSRCSTRQAPGPGAVRHLVPCRLAAAQGEGVGSCPVDGLDGVP